VETGLCHFKRGSVSPATGRRTDYALAPVIAERPFPGERGRALMRAYADGVPDNPDDFARLPAGYEAFAAIDAERPCRPAARPRLPVVNALALYGSIAGTIALGWQVFTWRRQNVSRVEVAITEGVIAPWEGTQDVVLITAINHSPYAIRVAAVGVDTPEGTVQVTHQKGEIPGVIQARDSATTWLPSDAPGLHGELRGWVRVGTRKVHRSKPYNRA
jgi:hypothetical protein